MTMTNRFVHTIQRLRIANFIRKWAAGIGALVVLSSASVWAATYTWDITPGTVGVGNGAINDGTAQWDTTLGTWTADGGANNVSWTNNLIDLAAFGGTG